MGEKGEGNTNRMWSNEFIKLNAGLEENIDSEFPLRT